MRLICENGQEQTWFYIFILFEPDDGSCENNFTEGFQIHKSNSTDDALDQEGTTINYLKACLGAICCKIKQMIRMWESRLVPFLVHILILC